MAPLALTVTRALFGLAERVAPSHGGNAAFRLFSRTPASRNPSPREREAIERYGRFMDDARHHRLRTAGGWISAHLFKPLVGAGTERTALVVHGWRSRAEHMVPIVMQLRAGGYRVVALDLPGHGRSAGRHLNMASAVEACAEAELWFGPFDVVVGHSFGGAVVLNAAAGSVRTFRPLTPARLVLISAPNMIPAIFDQFADALRLGPGIRAAMSQRVERLTGTPLAEFVGARQLARLTIPTLIVHAPDDREVAADDAAALAGAGPHVDVRWVPGAGHRRILADARLLEALADFTGGNVAEAARRMARRVSA
ncbi:MAG: alpha/beta hydrolase [Alphaproteobacteria bacterium]|nr:MAG: alpha/beta hydrolase [Alphaproteobacteria bacterium]